MIGNIFECVVFSIISKDLCVDGGSFDELEFSSCIHIRMTIVQEVPIDECDESENPGSFGCISDGCEFDGWFDG